MTCLAYYVIGMHLNPILLHRKIIKSILSNIPVNLDVQWSFDRENYKAVKSFGPCQPAQTAQADMG